MHGKPRTVRQLLTTFHLVFVAIDPAKRQNALLVPTAGRILQTFFGADCRVAWLSGGDLSSTKRLLGHWAEDILTFIDPDQEAIQGFGLTRLPAFVHLGADGTIVGASEGWHPQQWDSIAANLARVMHWGAPVVPGPYDPAEFEGTAVFT